MEWNLQVNIIANNAFTLWLAWKPLPFSAQGHKFFYPTKLIRMACLSSDTMSSFSMVFLTNYQKLDRWKQIGFIFTALEAKYGSRISTEPKYGQGDVLAGFRTVTHRLFQLWVMAYFFGSSIKSLPLASTTTSSLLWLSLPLLRALWSHSGHI